MKTWLWVSKGPMLSASLVPRLWPFPPRTMGDCLHLPAEAWFSWLGQIKTKVLAVKACTEPAAYGRGCVKTAPSLPHWFWPQGLIHPPTVRAVPGLSSCTDQDVKRPTFLGTGLAWWKPSGHVLTKSDRYWVQNGCHKTLARVVPPSTCPGREHCPSPDQAAEGP